MNFNRLASYESTQKFTTLRSKKLLSPNPLQRSDITAGGKGFFFIDDSWGQLKVAYNTMRELKSNNPCLFDGQYIQVSKLSEILWKENSNKKII